MNHQEILEKLKSGVDVLESKEDLGVLNAVVAARDIKKAMEFMRNGLKFGQLNFVTAVDWMANNMIEVVYRLYSYETNDNAVIRVKLDRAKPEVESICGVYRTAEWHEREAAEMFGINFLNHPDLKRLVLPEGVDKPLLKDFKADDFIQLPK